jgi:hypothetical protein
MTIDLQDTYYDLSVGASSFGITLPYAAGHVRLAISYDSIAHYADHAAGVEFSLTTTPLHSPAPPTPEPAQPQKRGRVFSLSLLRRHRGKDTPAAR